MKNQIIAKIRVARIDLLREAVKDHIGVGYGQVKILKETVNDQGKTVGSQKSGTVELAVEKPSDLFLLGMSYLHNKLYGESDKIGPGN